MNDMTKRGARVLEERPVALLKPHPNNARTHSPAQLRKLQASINRFGFVNPVLIDEEDRIIAGHGRVAAAMAMGLETVPVVYVSGMTEAERRAYVITDNRMAELVEWTKSCCAWSWARSRNSISASIWS
jgi:ParB-like chromosome segregation protein Spo0J